MTLVGSGIAAAVVLILQEVCRSWQSFSQSLTRLRVSVGSCPWDGVRPGPMFFQILGFPVQYEMSTNDPPRRHIMLRMINMNHPIHTFIAVELHGDSVVDLRRLTLDDAKIQGTVHEQRDLMHFFKRTKVSYCLFYQGAGSTA